MTNEPGPAADEPQWHMTGVVLGAVLAVLGVAAIAAAIGVGLTTTGVEPRNWIVTGAGGVGGAAVVLGAALLRRGLRQKSDDERIVKISQADLETMTKAAVDAATANARVKRGATKASAIKLMQAMAERAEDLWNKERGARQIWDRANWSLGGLGAFFAAASGGGVLSGLAGGWRYVLGFATLFGAALGAVAASLQTVRHAQVAAFKAKRYESFTREAWHDVLTVMPGLDASQAVALLQARSRELEEIEELGLPPVEERSRPKAKKS